MHFTFEYSKQEGSDTKLVIHYTGNDADDLRVFPRPMDAFRFAVMNCRCPQDYLDLVNAAFIFGIMTYQKEN